MSYQAPWRTGAAHRRRGDIVEACSPISFEGVPPELYEFHRARHRKPINPGADPIATAKAVLQEAQAESGDDEAAFHGGTYR